MKVWIPLFCLFFVMACRQPSGAEIKEYPFLPMELFEQQGAIQARRVPMHTFDRKYRSITYTANGEIRAAHAATALFPTDVLVVYLDGMEAPQVFLGRSPKSGCILQFNDEENVFDDPCHGSTFALDGTYINGPAEQDLDELPSEVRDGMLWLRNEIIYGAAKSVGTNR